MLPLLTTLNSGMTNVPDFSGEINNQNIIDIISNLSSHENRFTGSIGCNQSAIFIVQWLKNNTSAKVEFQYFSYESEISMNVIASIGNVGPAILLCAHYDSISSSNIGPGANDDASGIAAALEVFRILSSRSSELKYQIMFAAFAGEEQALLGSRAFVQQVILQQKNIIAVINFDTVGYGICQSINTNLASGWLADLLTSAALIQGIPCVRTCYQYPENSAGDHQSFWNVGIPAAWMYEYGPQYPFFHDARDTLEKVNIDLVGQAILICSLGVYLLSTEPLTLPYPAISIYFGLISIITIIISIILWKKFWMV
ncbi:MAG: M28 family metallopeptidase [Candidatus Helarchaeales archaeon]